MKKHVLTAVLFLVATSLNAQIFRPLEQMSDVERSVFLAERYWENFPFNDTAILQAQNFQGSIRNYLLSIRFADLPTIQRSLVETIRKADTNEKMYRHFVEAFDFYLNDPLSDIREEQWIEPVWRQMLKSRWSIAADEARIQFLLGMAAKNPVGSAATELEFVTIQGQRGRLSEIEAELLLVYFYIPGCVQCIMMREWIEEDTAYQELHNAGILQALAFYPEKDMSLFQSYRTSIPNTWINGRDPDGMSQLEEEGRYQMRGAPTIYLLDKDKKVLLKDARMDLLFEEFAKARERLLRE